MTRRARPRHKPRRPKWHTSGSFRYDFNGNGMSPLSIGLAAAEFFPADPAVWIDAAISASVRFCLYQEDQVIIDTKDLSNTGKFLLGQLYNTPGGEEALAAYMKDRKIKVVAI